jgi:hypothetical protein
LAASIPQRWNSTMCMMVYGAKWWRERGRTSGANFLEETRLDWCSHASTRQGCRAQQMFIDATLHFFFWNKALPPFPLPRSLIDTTLHAMCQCSRGRLIKYLASPTDTDLSHLLHARRWNLRCAYVL